MHDPTTASASKYRFSAAVIQRLLPIRPPYLLIDRIDDHDPGPPPALRAARALSVNDPVFAGHFPGLAVLPGSQILEGMAQASGVLAALVMLQRGFEQKGRPASEALEALCNLDRGFRLDPRYRPTIDDGVLAELQGFGGKGVGMLASSQVKFLHPVFPGDRLAFVTRLVREMDAVWQFEVDAEVDGAPVARGTLTTAVVSVRLPGVP